MSIKKKFMLIVDFLLIIVAIKRSESQIMSFTKIDYTMKRQDGNDEIKTIRLKQQDGNNETIPNNTNECIGIMIFLV